MMNTINVVVVDSKLSDDISPTGIPWSSGGQLRAEVRLTWSAAPTGRLRASWTAEP